MLDKSEVSLRVFAKELSFDEIVRLLGEPSYSHRRNDPIGRDGHALRTDSAWILTFDGPAQQPLERAIAFVKGKATEVSTLQTTCDVDICFALYCSHGQGGFLLDHSLMSKVAETNLDILFDLYPTSDDEIEHDILVPLR